MMSNLDHGPARIPDDQRPRRTPVVAVVAVTLAAALGAGIWIGWRTMTARGQPRLETASVAQVLDYLAAPRGFGALANADQEHFFEGLKQRYHDDAAQRTLKKYLDDLSEERLNAVRDALEPVILRQVIATAREYQALPADKKYPYLAAFRAKAEADGRWLSGNGDPAKDLRGRINTGLPTTPDQLAKFIDAKIRPEDLRAIEALVDDARRWDARQRGRRP